MSTLLDRLKKNSKNQDTAVLSTSKVFNTEFIPTDIPMLNAALSGDLEGGLTPGLTVISGPSRHFKSCFSLLMAASYMKHYSDAIMLFYDSEFGSPLSYFDTFGIDQDRVLHTPVTDIEQLKFDIMSQIEQLEKTDHVIIVVDSIGNLASKKEVEDALNSKSVADMTRAKALKGLFRMVTPHLTLKGIPMLAVAHTYSEMSLFPRQIVSGGSGLLYSANTVWIVGRQQNKIGKEIAGYHFVINVEKSRFVKEKAKIPISVTWNGGIEKYSGLLDISLLAGYVTKPKQGWYQLMDVDKKTELGKLVREKDTYTKEFWSPILIKEEFKDFIRDTYKIGRHSLIDTSAEIAMEGIES
jgi:hypothetical protein